MGLVPFAEDGHGRHVLVQEPRQGLDVHAAREHLPIHDGDGVGFGDDQLFPHVAEEGIGEDEDRSPEPLGEVEGVDGVVEALLYRGGDQGDRLVVAVGAASRLDHVALELHGGDSGGRDRRA